MSGGGVRVSIPGNVRKTIQNIKEITGNHSDEEIYAMLKECSMDPNETAQKLLYQDPFHEVKRKRDRKKENMNNRESGDSRWRSGMQGRGSRGGMQGQGSRGGRPSFSPRHTYHDTGGGRNSAAGRDNGTNHAAEKGAGSSLLASEEKYKETTPSASSSAVVANGPTGVVSGNTSAMLASNLPTGSNQHEVTSSPIVGREAYHIDVDKAPTIAFGTGDACRESLPSSNNSSMSVIPASSSKICFSSSDPVLKLSNDSCPPGTVGTIKREVGNHQTAGESASEIGVPFMPGKMPSKNQGVGKNQLSDSSQPSFASIQGGSFSSRPSSNYSSRSQLIIGSQKVLSSTVGSNMEWKPKATNPNVAQESGTAGLSDISNIPLESSGHSQASSGVLDSEEATAKLQKKLEELHLPQRQHVIIPHHIHVPESERNKLSFGSFDASFGVTSSYVSGAESNKSSTPVSETSQGIEEPMEEQAESNQNTPVTAEEGIYPDHPQSPSHVPGNLSAEGDASSNTVPDYESKQEAALLSGGHQYSVVHTSPGYSFGLVPPMLGSQIMPFENSESQARDVSRLPSFVVQQPFDPTSYYAQFYRSSADGDGRVSPFPAPGVASKYNGNVAVLPPHTSQPPQEGGNSLVLSTAGPTPLGTQAAGLMQSSIAMTQQPVPVFRPPTGLHTSHFPPNYIPYGHYISPIYVAPGMYQFLSNGTFLQQPQAGSVYPAPPSAAATGVKYSLPQFKPGSNTGNATHIGMPSGYGPYGSSPAGFNPNSAVTGGNSTTNDDLGASQFKESNIYITGQQSEGSAVWITTPGRDISSLPASTFYNLPPQGQHVAFGPTQASHGTYTNIYHPGQPVTAAAVHPLLQQSQAMGGAVDMLGPAASAYQQSQHQQINWPSNY
ncbi:GBF-interacting protein 1-like isoform X2 [Populus trichocarpa]|uniref:GBF-interacting protein 1-like isoform X2 n=1 Tax=Populus trichocarpa TaxID=3694 RepID=UPI00227809AD|nr:GBF-interacting protein 1-like isoform X2 [Populus trichocarpa]